MTLHTGRSYQEADVRIGPPPVQLIEQLPKAADVVDSVTHWLTAAKERDDVYYFAIFHDHVDQPVGQIFLHDMDQSTSESLIGYHLFQSHDRGRGIGTHALRLVQHFVVTATPLTKLVIITSRDNTASQSIAQKCNFSYVGVPREDLEQGMVFAWAVPRIVDAIRTV